MEKAEEQRRIERGMNRALVSALTEVEGHWPRQRSGYVGGLSKGRSEADFERLDAEVAPRTRRDASGVRRRTPAAGAAAGCRGAGALMVLTMARSSGLGR